LYFLILSEILYIIFPGYFQKMAIFTEKPEHSSVVDGESQTIRQKSISQKYLKILVFFGILSILLIFAIFMGIGWKQLNSRMSDLENSLENSDAVAGKIVAAVEVYNTAIRELTQMSKEIVTKYNRLIDLKISGKKSEFYIYP